MPPPSVDDVYTKIGTRRRVDREARFYAHLKGFLGAPRFYGTGSVSYPIGKKHLYMERIPVCLRDKYGDSDHRGPPYYGQVNRAYLDPKDPPMKAMPDVKEFFDYACQLALILGSLHANYGIAHRDVKPDNICIGDDGFLRLIDYDLAGHIEIHNEHERADWCFYRGTAKYAAPEMLLPKAEMSLPYDERCDSWSYGVTVLEMFTGIDVNSYHVRHKTQREIDSLVSKIVSTRTCHDTAAPLYNDVMALVSPCMQRRYQDRDYMARIAVEEGDGIFRAHLGDERVRELRMRYNLST